MQAPTVEQSHHQDRQIGVSLIAGIAVWFLHLNTAYPLVSLVCKWNWLNFNILGISGLQVVDTLITLVALVLMAYLIHTPWRIWRSYQAEKPMDNPQLLKDTEEERHALAAFIVMMLNSFFFLYIIANFVTIYALKACGQA